MAERRMFAKTIIDSDAFLDMPLSTQALYFHLGMRADDRGFLNNAKKIQRMVGASDDDLRVLISKKFVLVMDEGIIVIKHWNIHNYIRKDTFVETKYKGELEKLFYDDNFSYTLNDTGKNVLKLPTNPLQSRYKSVDVTVTHPSTQDRIVKDRIVKDSTVKDSIDDDDREITSSSDRPISLKYNGPLVYGTHDNVFMTSAEFNDLKEMYGLANTTDYIEKLSAYIKSIGKNYTNHHDTLALWLAQDRKLDI